MKIRDLAEVKSFLERMYSPDVRLDGVELAPMSVQTQCFVLGLAMGYEAQVEELQAKLDRVLGVPAL